MELEVETNSPNNLIPNMFLLQRVTLRRNPLFLYTIN